MDSKNKKNYYSKNKTYYKNKKDNTNNVKVKKYDDLVNIRNDVSEVENINAFGDDNNLILKVVMISIIVLAIVFGSLLLFHLI